MNSMDTTGQFLQIVSLISCLITGLLIFLIWRDRKFRNLSLVFFYSGSMLWFGWFLYISISREGFLHPELANLLPVYGFVALDIFLLQFARDYLRLHSPNRLSLPVVGTILFFIFGFQLTSLTINTFPAIPLQILYFLLLSLWIVILITGLFEYVVTYRRETQPLHRNRLIIWLPVPLINMIAGVLLFSAFSIAAVFAELLAVGLLGLLVVAPTLPDLKNELRRILRFGLVSSAIFVYILVFLLLFGLFREFFPQLNNLLAGTTVILTASLLARPALDLINRAALLLIPELSQQAEQIVRDFSRGLRSSPTLEDLVYQLITRIQEILPVNEVIVLNIEKAIQEDKAAYKISSFQNLPGHLDPLLLPDDDPICHQYLGQNKPLSQYQIDYTPELEQSTPVSRAWFERSHYDLFIPIVAKDRWIGLICLESKENGTPYTAAEIELLMSLSDQTAIAFENARLINGLARLNNEYRRAYTALERTNSSLEQTVRQLEKLDRFKSDLITVLSHEIRTPMTLIAGHAQMLLDEPDMLQHPEWTEFVEGIARGTGRLEDIVGAILDMASIDARSLDLSIKTVDVLALVQGIVRSLEQDLVARQIKVNLEGLSGLPYLDTDPQLLEKALGQIISNSIKYSPDHSEITITGKQLLPEDSPIGENSVQLTIIDRGIGLDEDQLELVFEKLYQTGAASAHSSGKTKFKGGGPGLGLAIVKGIVTELHGTVWAESGGHDEQQLPGTTIHIVLPLRRVKSHKPQSSPGTTRPLDALTAEGEEGDSRFTK